jgi:hypothetical protein
MATNVLPLSAGIGNWIQQPSTATRSQAGLKQTAVGRALFSPYLSRIHAQGKI